MIKQTQPDRYQSIKELALNNLVALYFNTNRSDRNYRDEVLANDIWAVIFEHRLMGIDPDEVSDSGLGELLRVGYDIIATIDAGSGDVFGEEFNSLYRARETVMDWLRRGGTFTEAASLEKEKLLTESPDPGDAFSVPSVARPLGSRYSWLRIIYDICKTQAGMNDVERFIDSFEYSMHLLPYNFEAVSLYRVRQLRWIGLGLAGVMRDFDDYEAPKSRPYELEELELDLKRVASSESLSVRQSRFPFGRNAYYLLSRAAVMVLINNMLGLEDGLYHPEFREDYAEGAARVYETLMKRNAGNLPELFQGLAIDMGFEDWEQATQYCDEHLERFLRSYIVLEVYNTWISEMEKAPPEQLAKKWDIPLEAVPDHITGGRNLPEGVILTGGLNSRDVLGFSPHEETIRELLLANRDQIHQMPFRQSAFLSAALNRGTYSYKRDYKVLFPNFQQWLFVIKNILKGEPAGKTLKYASHGFEAILHSPVKHVVFFELPEQGLVDPDTGVYVKEASLWQSSTRTLYVCVTPENSNGICKELMRNIFVRDGIVSHLSYPMSYPKDLTPLINTLSDIAVMGLYDETEVIPEHIANAITAVDINTLLKIRTQLLSFGYHYRISDFTQKSFLDATVERARANRQYAFMAKYIYELLEMIDNRLMEIPEFEQLSKPDRIATACEVRDHVLSASLNEQMAWQALMDLAPLDCQKHIVLLQMAVHVIKTNIPYSLNINKDNRVLLEAVSKNAETILQTLREVDRRDGELAAFCRFLVHRTISSDYSPLYGTWAKPTAEVVTARLGHEPIMGFRQIMRPWTELQRLLRIPPGHGVRQDREPQTLGEMRTALVDYYTGLGIQYAPPMNLTDPRFSDAYVRSTDPVLLYLLLRYGISAEALQLFTIQPCHRRGDPYPFFEMAGREMVDTKPIDTVMVLRDKIRFAAQVCRMELERLHVTLLDPDKIPAQFKDAPEFIERYNHDKIHQALLDLGIRPENIHLVGADENWWNQGGIGIPDIAGSETRGWLYGPSIELFFDRGIEYGCHDPECRPGCKKCNRFIEWGNTLTMTAIKVETPDGETHYQWLPPGFYMAEDVMGLERLVMAVKNLGSEYDVYEMEKFCTSIRSTVPAHIRGIVPEEELTYSVHAIAGGLKTLLFIIADGAHKLGAEQRKSYIKTTARDVLAEMAGLGIDRKAWMPLLLDELVSYYPLSYPHLVHAVEDTCDLLEEREAIISANLKRCIRGTKRKPGLMQMLRDFPDYELTEEDLKRFTGWGAPSPYIRQAAMLLRIIVKNNCVIHPEDMTTMAWVFRIPETDLKSMLMQPSPTGLGLKIQSRTSPFLTPIINPDPPWVRIRAFSNQFGQLSREDAADFIKTGTSPFYMLEPGAFPAIIAVIDRAQNLPITDGINTRVEKKPWVDEHGRRRIKQSLAFLLDHLPSEDRKAYFFDFFLVSDGEQNSQGWLHGDLATLFGDELKVRQTTEIPFTYRRLPSEHPQPPVILIGPTSDVVLLASAIRRVDPDTDILVGPCFEPDLIVHRAGMEVMDKMGCRFWQGPPEGAIADTKLKTIDVCFKEGSSTVTGIGREPALHAVGAIITLGQKTLRQGPPVILEAGPGIIEPGEVAGLPQVVRSGAKVLSVDSSPTVPADLRWMQDHGEISIGAILERSSSRVVGSGGVRMRPGMWERLGIEGIRITDDKKLSVDSDIRRNIFVEDAFDIVAYLPFIGSRSISQVILGNVLNNLPYQPDVELSTMQFVYSELERILQPYGIVTCSTNACFLHCPDNDKRGVFAPLKEAGLCPLYMSTKYANVSEGAIMENLDVIAGRPGEYEAFPNAEEAIAIAMVQLDKTLPEDLKPKLKEREKVTLEEVQRILGTEDGTLEENLIYGKETLLFLVKTGDKEYFIITVEGSYYEVFERLATHGDGFYPDITEELGVRWTQEEHELYEENLREKENRLQRVLHEGLITIDEVFTGLSTVASPERNPDFWRLALGVADRSMGNFRGDVLMPAPGPYDLWTAVELASQFSQDARVVGIDWNAVITAINMMIQRRAVQGDAPVPIERIAPHTGTVTVEEAWLDNGRRVLNNTGVHQVRLEGHNLVVPRNIAERVVVLPAQDFSSWLTGVRSRQYGCCLAGNWHNNALFQHGMTFEKMVSRHRDLLKVLIPGGIYAFTSNALFWNDTRQNHLWNLGQVLDESGWEVLVAIIQHAEIMDETIIGENIAVLACEKGRHRSFPDAERAIQIVEKILRRYEIEELDIIKRSGTYEQFRKSIESGNETNIVMIKTGVDTVWYVNLPGDYKTAFIKLVSLEDGKGFHPDIIEALSKEIAQEAKEEPGPFSPRLPGDEELSPARAVKMEDVKVLSATKIIEENGRTERRWFPTNIPINKHVVVIAMDVDEYEGVKYLQDYQDRVDIQVVNVSPEDAIRLDLKPYQILILETTEEVEALSEAILPYGLNGIELDVMKGVNESTRRTIWTNV